MHYWLADLLAIMRQALRTLADLLPYVVAGALLSAALMRWRSRLLDKTLKRMAGWPLPAMIALAACTGTLSPLCTLGTVPLIVGLLGFGLHPAAAVAFLAASSLINPQVFIIMAGTIGFPMALVQWGLSWLIGMAAGALAFAAGRAGHDVLRPDLIQKPENQGKSCHRHRKSFWRTFAGQLEFVLIYVVIGVLLGATVNVLVPGGVIEQLFARARMASVAAGAIASVPLYVCGGGILPLLAELMKGGMPGGIVLAFITAGPATRFQSLAAIAVLLRNWSLALYVLLIWLCAFVAGVAWNLILE